MGWEIISGAVIALLAVLDSRRENEQNRVNESLQALGDAYYSTVTYYDTDFTNSSAKRHEQLLLAQKWDRVANLTRQFDSNIASRFSLKSRFWQDGEAWSSSKIKGAKISLENIRRDVRFLLIPKQKKG
ncbi:hypothetical protein [Candidatus Endoriftia persephone]|uniref:Uncharacterized protein n=1 Tax=Candidatus Endoriftia persephonae TaxID=393765 RepID=A0A9J6ZUB0_9GAMM|nr:hypothetical protein [Candidatus Endoriftia persephone]USF86372.1 hypothetical protein L0Y14_09460 [Candidatus Endoriftia persephone]